MAVDIFAYTYAAVVTLGGIIGFVKKGSVVSGLAGVLCGAAAGVGAYQTSQNPNNYYLSLGVSMLLTGVMGSRFINSGKIMPAGIVTVLSLCMIARYGYRMVQGPSST